MRKQQKSKSICDLACEILEKTHDGDDLAPHHLKLLELAVNGRVNEKEEVAFYELHDNVLKGYKKPWYHDIENMTQDHEGFIYWRGVQVEHYSHDSYEDADKESKELERRCKILESKGVKPTTITAIWKWVDKR